MARRHGPVSNVGLPLRRTIAGGVALAALAMLAAGAFAGLLLEGRHGWHGAQLDSWMWRVARFTLIQALLSTVLSIVPALLIARALSRHPHFPGRELLLRLFGVPLALPAIVAALGVLALYGRAGLLAPVFTTISGENWQGIYGLSGILIAHVFFNLPLAVRFFLEALNTIPNDQWRLAAQLGMRPLAEWRLIEWPVLRNVLPGVAGLVLMLCITSFTLVLTLGGGPSATTLEVAIYQALRFDFDPGRAVVLTVAQLVLTLVLLALMSRLGSRFIASGELNLTHKRYSEPAAAERVLNTVLILAAALFVLGPLAAVLHSGLAADLMRLIGEDAVRQAMMTSILLAFFAAILSLMLALALIAMRKGLEQSRAGRPPGLLERASEQAPLLVLALPPIVIGAGWFILLRHAGNVLALAPVMVVLVNAAMALPFVTRAIRPAYDRSSDRHDRLAESLGMKGIARVRLVTWPVLRRPLLTGFAFAMALSLGDLGVIALFGSERVQTLPYLLLMRLGSYRTEDAAGLALLLSMLTLLLMWLATSGKKSS